MMEAGQLMISGEFARFMLLVFALVFAVIAAFSKGERKTHTLLWVIVLYQAYGVTQ